MIHKITKLIEKPQRDFIYDLLAELPLKLAVDIGAAAGMTTNLISKAGGDNVSVVAFEPFPGNHGYFLQNTASLTKVTLVKKAVGKDIGPCEFLVPSVVVGTEQGWEQYKGYSSVGFLKHQPINRWTQYLRAFLDQFRRSNTAREIQVDVTTIDKEFKGHLIDFMKMDVQGTEKDVLAGSCSLLEQQAIRLLYIEWSGCTDVIQVLIRNDYQIYDSTYVTGPKDDEIRPFEEIGFRFLEEIVLSTGKVAFELILPEEAPSPEEAIHQVQARNLGWIQTDLIAIRQNEIVQFEEAARKYWQNTSEST